MIVDTDAASARATGQRHLALYLTLPNYVNNFREMGFGDADFAGGGSDRLVDALVAWGEASCRGRPGAPSITPPAPTTLAIQAIPDRAQGRALDDLRVLAPALLR